MLSLLPPPSVPTPATTPGRAPSVSIVIPAHNEEAVIERCLKAAIDQVVPAREILVIDNRSTDATAELARRIARRHPEAGIRVLDQSEELGLVPTRNLGFEAASGDVLGRIDADTVVLRDWVARVAETMTDPAVGAVSGPVTYYDLPFRAPRGLSDDLARRALRRLGKRYPFLYGCNMAIRATAWRAIEHEACRDRQDVLHEDIDLSVHLYDANVAVAYDGAMRADVSARRLSTSRESFRAYTERFERTYAAHRIDDWHLRVPQALLQSVYWWARVLRSIAPAPRAAIA
ncbi:glycosyltransferase family 2 protein [Microbacterium betulae]|uniref:Glycosyltransferase family 2 protein n=1 Tax=Microbacterium betulae TaxID=2981139 RepID=A0AA97FIF5_9MICO|nr:glycosyltransferase family 2 protein [Microbacterium sp. AB]WOF22880.1 glycosyltransferase family 2 protein [Microbacterium sp. AB]